MKAIVIAGALTLAMAGAAEATCVQSDGAGKWRLFPAFVNPSTKSLDWYRCTLIIDSVGNIEAKSFCIDSGGQKFSGASGTLTIANSCSLSGSFLVSSQTVTLTDGQLSKDKQSMTGVGSAPLGLFIFTGLKQ